MFQKFFMCKKIVPCYPPQPSRRSPGRSPERSPEGPAGVRCRTRLAGFPSLPPCPAGRPQELDADVLGKERKGKERVNEWVQFPVRASARQHRGHEGAARENMPNPTPRATGTAQILESGPARPGRVNWRKGLPAADADCRLLLLLEAWNTHEQHAACT